MSKLVQCFAMAAFAAAIAFGNTQAQAQNDAVKAQNKLLTMRAARVDAIRKMAERIQGLHITSKTTVRDFVAESDTIHACLDAFLNGMKETRVAYKEDGTCEVTMEVKLEEVVTTLKQVCNRYYKGDKFKAEDFTEITQENKDKVLTEVGTGAPPSKEDQVGETVAIPEKGLGEKIGYGRNAEKYWKANVKPSGRLMALRAARLEGMRRLVERIAGTHINSDTIVRDFVTESDQIESLAEDLLSGAREKSVRYHDNEPVVEIEMAVTLETVLETVKTWSKRHYKGDKVKIKEFEERVQKVQRKEITEIGMGCVGEKYMIHEAPAEVMATAKAAMAWPAVISETGNAAIDAKNPDKAQAMLMAKRAAELDARRKLAEKIDGLEVGSKTTVKDFVTQHDDIRTAMQTFQQGAYVVEGSVKELPDGTCEATVAIDPAPLWDTVMRSERTTTVKKVAPKEE